MKKTILSLCLSLLIAIAPTFAQEETNPAPALRPAIELIAPTVETTAPAPKAEESATKKLYKKAWTSCKRCAKKTAHAAKEVSAHPLLTLKKTPDATVKTLKVCHAKALDFSDNHERDFKLIGNLTTLFGAYFFARNSFNNFGKSTNKTVIVSP